MSWVNTVVAAAERQGLGREPLLARAGLAIECLDEPRWPIDDITRLWRAAAELTADPSFGLNAGRTVGPGSFNVVSYILLSSATLRAGLGVLQQYQRLISDGGRFQILAGERQSWVVYHPQQAMLAFSPHQVEAVLAATVRFSRWVTGRALQPVRVQFSHRQLGPLAAYTGALGAGVQFEQAFNGLLLDNAELDAPLPQADAELASLHRAHAAAQLAALSAPQPLRTRVEQWLVGALDGSVPGRAEAARQFGLGEKALARRLMDEGVRYSGLVDGVRRQLACAAVAGGGESFARIARRLGFSEASAFNRAFRRWTGQAPGDWQQRLPPAPRPAPPGGP
jgi:AraC-like DNA-binding protein